MSRYVVSVRDMEFKANSWESVVEKVLFLVGRSEAVLSDLDKAEAWCNLIGYGGCIYIGLGYFIEVVEQ